MAKKPIGLAATLLKHVIWQLDLDKTSLKLKT